MHRCSGIVAISIVHRSIAVHAFDGTTSDRQRSTPPAEATDLCGQCWLADVCVSSPSENCAYALNRFARKTGCHPYKCRWFTTRRASDVQLAEVHDMCVAAKPSFSRLSWCKSEGWSEGDSCRICFSGPPRSHQHSWNPGEHGDRSQRGHSEMQ